MIGPDRNAPSAEGESIPAPLVVALGECLWDRFPDGARFGGAPANFACHAAALGAEAHLVSAIGDDAPGDEALHILRTHRVHSEAVARLADIPTGSVQVTLDDHGRPSYVITDNVAWDQIPWTSTLGDLAARADAVCFGTLAQRSAISRQTIERFLDQTRPDCLRVLDVNLRGDFYDRARIESSLRRATVLKFSDEELPVLARLFDLPARATEMAQIQRLRETFGLAWVVLTRGSRGAIMAGECEEVTADSKPVDIQDTVGAGDAFTAALTVGLLSGWPAKKLLPHACRVAEYVCTQPGAVPHSSPTRGEP